MRSVAVVLTLLVACKSEKPADAPPAEPAKPAPVEATKPTPEPTPAAPPTPTTSAGTWAFKLNGTGAQTAPRGPNDKDEPVLSYQLANGHGFASFYGDLDGNPRRGFLTADIDNFKPEVGEKKARIKFTRYLDAGGGKQTGWHTKKDAAVFTITAIREKERNPVGMAYLASGTFEAKGLELDLGNKSDVTTLDITEGTFTDLLIQEIGKK